jgi:serralysin
MSQDIADLYPTTLNRSGDFSAPWGGLIPVRFAEQTLQDQVLIGGEGDDVLIGAAGGDRLDGRGGSDTLTGGAGADVFVFNAGHDRITDFEDNQDKLLFDAQLWGNTARTTSEILSLYAAVQGPDVVFQFPGGDSLVVEGIAIASMLDDDIWI